MADGLSPEAEVLAAHMAASLASFHVLVLCLQRSGALKEGEFPQALAEYMDAVKGSAEPLTIELLGDLREALLN
jgi:hypothetical protein